MMPDIPFLMLGLISDIGWMIHLIAGVIYFCRNGFCHVPDYAALLALAGVLFGIAYLIYLNKIHEKDVYHNITGEDKQALLLETLRVLKKGGTFAIHDLMSPRRYGDMQAFVQKLREMGYERVELIDTTTGKFMTPKEAKRLMLHGSTLLVGRK